nr:unnamed protein product [Callosobruchus analis]
MQVVFVEMKGYSLYSKLDWAAAGFGTPLPSGTSTFSSRCFTSYYVSPVNSAHCDVDDSDKDPNFTDNDVSSSSGSSDPGQTVNCEIMAEKAENQPKKEKKRTRNQAKLKNRDVKRLRNSGKAYTYISSSKSRKRISERKVRPPCGEKCRLE